MKGDEIVKVGITWERREMHAEFCKKERPHGKLRRRWDVNIKWILKKLDGKIWTGFPWLSILSSGRHL